MAQYCSICKDYYNLASQSVACPHEPTTLSEEGRSRVGRWSLPREVELALDSAYREDNRDAIRVYIGHSNAVIRQYAEDKLTALDLANEIKSKPQEYGLDSQQDGQQNKPNYIYIKELEGE